VHESNYFGWGKVYYVLYNTVYNISAVYTLYLIANHCQMKVKVYNTYYRDKY